MNHAFNAKIHKLPACPECGAAELEPCVTFAGGSQAREPHQVRWRVKTGQAFVFDLAAARSARKVRAVRELAAAISGSAPRAARKRRAR